MAELRSALALHGLLRPRGQTAESVALLAPLYRSFTEGSTLPELLQARAILAELTETPPTWASTWPSSPPAS